MKRMKVIFSALLILPLFVGSLINARASMPSVLLDSTEIGEMVDNYIESNGLNSDLISIGYRYTETGETWFFNEQKWYYSASLYKVPLMMLLAEKESRGELDQDSVIYNWKLSEIEKEVLVYSNNVIAYSMLLYFGEPNETRKLFQRYSSLQEEEYPWDFYASSFFSVPFMTDVMTTLYEHPDQFPGIAELLTQAQPDHYFRRNLENRGIPIAQKYGTYHDQEDRDWNHACAVFYTEHPFVLTVMTRYGGISEIILGDLAELFYEYSLEVDTRYEMLNAEQLSNTGAPEDSVVEEDKGEGNVPEFEVGTISVNNEEASAAAIAPALTDLPEASEDSSPQDNSRDEVRFNRGFLLALLVILLACMGMLPVFTARRHRHQQEKR